MSQSLSIAERLKQLRLGARLTQAQLAGLLSGSSAKRITNIERGARRPSLDLVEQWAAACGRRLTLSFEPLIERDEEDPELMATLRDLVESPPRGSTAREALKQHLSAWKALAARPGGA
jgi:transcriptional regulator with XRE-family HTH domain